MNPWGAIIIGMDFDDVKAPWDVAGSQLVEPSVGTAFDELLFGSVHGFVGTNFAVGLAGFHLNKEEEFVVTSDDIDLPFVRSTEVGGEDFVALSLQPSSGDFFSVVTQPFGSSWVAVAINRVARRVEQPAETSDGDACKGHGSVELQDAP